MNAHWRQFSFLFCLIIANFDVAGEGIKEKELEDVYSYVRSLSDSSGYSQDARYRWVHETIQSVRGSIESEENWSKFLSLVLSVGTMKQSSVSDVVIKLDYLYHEPIHDFFEKCLKDEDLWIQERAFDYLLKHGRSDLLEKNSNFIKEGIQAYHETAYKKCHRMNKEYCENALRAISDEIDRSSVCLIGDKLLARLQLKKNESERLRNCLVAKGSRDLPYRAMLGDTVAEEKLILSYEKATDYEDARDAALLLSLAGTPKSIKTLIRVHRLKWLKGLSGVGSGNRRNMARLP